MVSTKTEFPVDRPRTCTCTLLRTTRTLAITFIFGTSLDRNALDHGVCASSHVTAPISQDAGKLAMAARVTRKTQEYVACARSWFWGSSAGALERIGVRSIVVSLDHSSCMIERTTKGYDFFFPQFHPFKPNFKPKTYNTLKY